MTQATGWKYAVAGFLGAWLLRCLRWSWRIRQVPLRTVLDRRERRGDGPGCIYMAWHSRILLSAATQMHLGVHVMVSQHGDGEYIARAIERLGFRTIRGSTTRGGGRALVETVRVLREGGDASFAIDGPRGPRFRVQPGCVIAASKTGALLVPIGFECRSKKRLRSWDRFVVPWPFTRVQVIFGEEIHVPPDLSRDEIADWCVRVQEAMVDVTREAAEAVGVPAETPDDVDQA